MRMALVAFVVGLMALGPGGGRSENESRAAAPPAWLGRLNEYRALAGLPDLAVNANWSRGAKLHSKYVVKNDEIVHAEDPAKPFYTPAGDAAGRNGNVQANYVRSTLDTYAIDVWMSGPFHGVGMIDPRLAKTGFGSYRETGPGLQQAATLDTNRGLRPLPASTTFPIVFPEGELPLSLTRFESEYPDPLTSCPGYTAPAGPAILVLLGQGSVTPSVSAHSLKSGGKALPHCVMHEGTYTNPDRDAQALGRAILDFRDAVVIIPKAPLEPGKTYNVFVRANGKNVRWSFTVASHGH